MSNSSVDSNFLFEEFQWSISEADNLNPKYFDFCDYISKERPPIKRRSRRGSEEYYIRLEEYEAEFVIESESYFSILSAIYIFQLL